MILASSMQNNSALIQPAMGVLSMAGVGAILYLFKHTRDRKEQYFWLTVLSCLVFMTLKITFE